MTGPTVSVYCPFCGRAVARLTADSSDPEIRFDDPAITTSKRHAFWRDRDSSGRPVPLTETPISDWWIRNTMNTQSGLVECLDSGKWGSLGVEPLRHAWKDARLSGSGKVVMEEASPEIVAWNLDREKGADSN